MALTKRSRQKEVIMEVLNGTKCHPTAGYIHENVKKRIPNISLGTVYRNLSKFKSEGSIKSLDVGTGSEHFDGDTSPHYHVVCTECHRIMDIYEHDEELDRIAKKHFDGVVTGHSLVFYGKCKNCI